MFRAREKNLGFHPVFSRTRNFVLCLWDIFPLFVYSIFDAIVGLSDDTRARRHGASSSRLHPREEVDVPPESPSSEGLPLRNPLRYTGEFWDTQQIFRSMHSRSPASYVEGVGTTNKGVIFLSMDLLLDLLTEAWQFIAHGKRRLHSGRLLEHPAAVVGLLGLCSLLSMVFLIIVYRLVVQPGIARRQQQANLMRRHHPNSTLASSTKARHADGCPCCAPAVSSMRSGLLAHKGGGLGTNGGVRRDGVARKEA